MLNIFILLVIVAFFMWLFSSPRRPYVIFDKSLTDYKIFQEGRHNFLTDGTNIWFTNRILNSVENSVICFDKKGEFLRVLNNQIDDRYNFNFPYDMSFDGINIWVTNTVNNSITIFRASDGSFVKNINI